MGKKAARLGTNAAAKRGSAKAVDTIFVHLGFDQRQRGAMRAEARYPPHTALMVLKSALRRKNSRKSGSSGKKLTAPWRRNSNADSTLF